MRAPKTSTVEVVSHRHRHTANAIILQAHITLCTVKSMVENLHMQNILYLGVTIVWTTMYAYVRTHVFVYFI